MIVFSNKNKNSLLDVKRNRYVYNPKDVSFGFDFGKCLAYDSMDIAYKTVINNYLSDYIDVNSIFDLFKTISDGEVYCYLVNEEDVIIKHLTISEMLESNDMDYFAIGVLLQLRRIHLGLSISLEYEIEDDDRLLYQLSMSELERYVLWKDTSGKASLLVDMKADNKKLYEKVKALDTTGELVSVYYNVYDSYRDDIGNKILEIDNKGDYVIESLKWLKGSPYAFAERIVELGNPFKAIDFKLEYMEIVEELRSVNEESEFILAENEVLGVIDRYLLNSSYKSSLNKLYDKNNHYLNNEEMILRELFKVLSTTEYSSVFLDLVSELNSFNKSLAYNLELITKNELDLVDTLEINGYIILKFIINDVVLRVCKEKDRAFELLSTMLKDKYNTISLTELF